MGSTKHARRVAMALGALGLLAATVAVTAAPATAAGPVPVLCDTAGTLRPASADGVTTWTLSMDGICSGALGSLTVATIQGTGTSSGTGLCDQSLLTDLTLDVVVAERDVVTGRTVRTNQTWTVPVGTYVATNVFTIGGDASGVGTLSTKLFAQCDAGTPAARAVFSFAS